MAVIVPSRVCRGRDNPASPPSDFMSSTLIGIPPLYPFCFLTMPLPRAVPALLFSCLLASCSGGGNSAERGGAVPPHLRVMTFNTGTPDCAPGTSGDWTCDDAEVASEWYGTGLAHQALLPDVRQFVDTIAPDIVALQEVFDVGRCPEIPAEARPGFICEHWQPGDPGVAAVILGDGYQIACHRDRPDKCLAVRTEMGRFRGCDDVICPSHLAGGMTDSCGGGTRIGRGVIDFAAGGSLTVVSVHGTSGVGREDQACRVQQFEQVFSDILDGTGQAAASGAANLVLGDLNTDPGRLALIDQSAARWNDFVGDGLAFSMITQIGLLAPPTYARLLNIDHVASDVFDGTCFPGTATETVAFDHRPIVCDITHIGASDWEP